MSKFTKEMVDSYAKKLLIGLTDEENELVLKEFDIIENSMEAIANIKGISDVEPMTHCLDDFEFTIKEDEPLPSIDREDALRNCDVTEDCKVSVPKVVG